VIATIITRCLQLASRGAYSWSRSGSRGRQQGQVEEPVDPLLQITARARELEILLEDADQPYTSGRAVCDGSRVVQQADERINLTILTKGSEWCLARE